MAKVTVNLSAYVDACRPVVGARTAFPHFCDPARKALEMEITEAIAVHGWPADLASVLALQQSAEEALEGDTVEGSPTFVALLGIDLACNERMASQAIQSHSDCVAKLTWLRRELLGAAGDSAWIRSLDDAIAWHRRLPCGTPAD